MAALNCKLDQILACLEVIKAEIICNSCTFRVFYADVDSGGLWDSEYVHTATVNGSAVPDLPFDASTVTNPMKSMAYVNVVAGVNALAGHSMVLENDVAIGDGLPPGKPSYLVTVPAGSTLVIENTHSPGQVITLTAGEDGECSWTFTDGDGNEITSFEPEVI